MNEAEKKIRWIVQESSTTMAALNDALAAARAEGYAKAREQAATLCEQEAKGQRESRATLDAATPAGRAAHTYSEERERMADFLAHDIRTMQDERDAKVAACRCEGGAHYEGDKPVVCDGCHRPGGCTGPGWWNTPHWMCPHGGTWRTA